eukprot:TRINITY_DN8638_c0_g2_i3.p1 TRINITY_DN8638_c0_g2~~TRINITY_DN8638_c0_g2_i3.p1  ORF type:complete len:459 (+),score=103.28 TRINITY_DN8638_c0_g2_i3:116-1492(+)
MPKELVLTKGNATGYGFVVSRHLVTKVKAGSPAAIAGLQEKDRILSVNNHTTQGMAHTRFVAIVSQAREQLKLEIALPGETPSSSRRESADVQVNSPPATAAAVTSQLAKTTLATTVSPASPPLQPSLPTPKRTSMSATEQTSSSSVSDAGLRHVPLPEDKPAPAPVVTSDPSLDNGLRKTIPRLPATSKASPTPTNSTTTTTASTTSAASSHKTTNGSTSSAPARTPRTSNPALGNITKALRNSAARKSGSGPSELSPTAAAVAASVVYGEPFKHSDGKTYVTKTDKDGNVYMMEAHTCFACNKLITESYSELDGHKYHQDCIRCADCGLGLVGKNFSLEPRGPVCETCWAKESGLFCCGCQTAITPDMDGRAPYLTLGDMNYHPHCVKCVECDISFGAGVEGPFKYNNKLYCREHVREAKQITNSGIRSSKGLGLVNAAEDEKLRNIMKSSKSGWR